MKSGSLTLLVPSGPVQIASAFLRIDDNELPFYIYFIISGFFFYSSAPNLFMEFIRKVQSCIMPLCTEKFNAHLIVCRDCVISFSSCSKSKDAKVGRCVGQRRAFMCVSGMY